MIKKLYNQLYAHRFVHYFMAGGSAFVLDFITLLFFKEYFKLNPILAVALNQMVVIVYVFFAHKFWSFQAGGDTTRQMFRFIILLVLNYIFSVIWMWFWISILAVSWSLNLLGHNTDIAYLGVRTANVILATSWNFFLYRFWVYKIKELPIA